MPGKHTRRLSAVSSRRTASQAARPAAPVAAESDVVEDDAVPIQRPNSSRRSTRRDTPQSVPIPTSYKIIGIATVVILVVVVFGYGPFMRYRLTGAIDSAATMTERMQAADSLYARRDGYAYGIFHQRLVGTEMQARDASAYGMSLIARENGALSVSATDDLASALPALDPLGKCVFTALLGRIAKAIPKPDFDKKMPDDDSKKIAIIAKTLIPETKNSDVTVRVAAIDALCEVPAPGVCNALLAAAANDTDGNVKMKARNGIFVTALPDAAGNLLLAVASSDAELKKEASAAFKKVREKAKSEDLLPLVNSPEESVRKEIVAALGKRPADSKAAEGVTQALKDTSAEIRKLAVKSVQLTGVAGPVSQLLPLISDADESVRVQCAETLGELRDEGSKKILIEAFGSGPQGETLVALSKSLGKRSNGKDIPVIGVLIDQMNKRSESFAGIREALVRMTNAKQGARRDAERMTWDAARWNAWWDNISKREKIKNEALSNLKKADARKQEGNKFYPELSKMTNDAFDMLEKCREMNNPDDLEDDAEIAGIENKYKGNKYYFEKHQVLDLSGKK